MKKFSLLIASLFLLLLIVCNNEEPLIEIEVNVLRSAIMITLILVPLKIWKNQSKKILRYLNKKMEIMQHILIDLLSNFIPCGEAFLVEWMVNGVL